MLRLYGVLYCLNQEDTKISHCSSLGAVASVEPPTNEHINLGRVRAVVHTSVNLLVVWGSLPVIKAVKPQPIRMGDLESGSWCCSWEDSMRHTTYPTNPSVEIGHGT